MSASVTETVGIDTHDKAGEVTRLVLIAASDASFADELVDDVESIFESGEEDTRPLAPVAGLSKG